MSVIGLKKGTETYMVPRLWKSPVHTYNPLEKGKMHTRRWSWPVSVFTGKGSRLDMALRQGVLFEWTRSDIPRLVSAGN